MSTEQSSDILTGLSDNQSNEISPLVLPEVVPDEVRVDCHGACVLWLFGSRFPHFYAWTVLHIGISLEIAFRIALSNRGIRFRKDERLERLFSLARENGVIDDSGLRDSEYLREYFELHDFRQSFEHDLAEIADAIAEQYQPKTFGALVDDLLAAIRHARNELAHSRYVRSITKDVAHHFIQLARSILVALFRSTG